MLLNEAVCVVIKEMSGTCTLKLDNFFFILFGRYNYEIGCNFFVHVKDENLFFVQNPCP